MNIDRHRGRIANTAGDSVLAEFASVLDAVHCAIEIQKTLANANEVQPEARSMRFRIGINVGDVMAKDGDIFGDGVNVAARLEGLAKGGEICVSRGVRDYLRHHVGMSLRIWANSSSRTSPTRCAPFGSAWGTILPALPLRGCRESQRHPTSRLLRRRFPNCRPTARPHWSSPCGKASGTAAPASLKPTLSSPGGYLRIPF
jgi:hypothetical protein